jgi:hypothetical protein
MSRFKSNSISSNERGDSLHPYHHFFHHRNAHAQGTLADHQQRLSSEIIPYVKDHVRLDLKLHWDQIIAETFRELQCRCRCRNCGEDPGGNLLHHVHGNMGSSDGRVAFNQLSQIDVVGINPETVDWEKLSWLTWRFYETERR